MTANGTRDIVVIGSSAGGVEALPKLLSQLPADIPASVFIVQHQAPRPDPYLVEILKRATPMPVAWAEQGAKFEHAHVYVAPPDLHLTFVDEHLRLSASARENRSRPSIDCMFRSAADAYGGRTIGVVLTGLMSDGVAGAQAIHDAGGRVVIQDPADAEYPQLPQNVADAVPADASVPLATIGRTLVDMMHEPVEAAQPMPRLPELVDGATRSVVSCPECGGPLWLLGDLRTRRWRCFLGHALGAIELLEANGDEIEAALWNAVRALQDRAATLDTLARDATELHRGPIADDYAARAAETREQAEIARRFMLDMTTGRR